MKANKKKIYILFFSIKFNRIIFVLYNDNDGKDQLLDEFQMIFYQYFPLNPEEKFPVVQVVDLDSSLVSMDTCQIETVTINTKKENDQKSTNVQTDNKETMPKIDKVSNAFPLNLLSRSSQNSSTRKFCYTIFFLWIITFSIYFAVLLILESNI
jgi:predicted ATP-binding protein involved in virulence